MTPVTMETTDRHVAPRLLTGTGSALADHIATHGVLGIPTGNEQTWAAHIREAVSASGLLGRGGAGFPSAAKWNAVGQSRRKPMVVVNAMEGEPASRKDRTLLCHAPHLVLDGAEVTAAVTGASDVVVCVAHDNGPAAASVARAVAERQRSGVARSAISVVRPPGRYVTGEESALVSWLDHHKALPRLRIDKSVPLEVARRPVVVHNAETLSQIALIARHGPDWFHRLGTPQAPGSTLVTISGAVRSPGVFEVELGTPVLDILHAAGLDTELSGVLLGGYGALGSIPPCWRRPTRRDP